jgi:uncharacterized protein YbjT (DUF2867 family)
MSVRIELNHRIHVLTRKEELDGVRARGKVVVVLDILFATTTMVAALARRAARSVIALVAGEADQQPDDAIGDPVPCAAPQRPALPLQRRQGARTSANRIL